ncbi:MAG: aromatic acid exporter family protein [Lachnospiraceae bacterium]|nr:aromatic acid exporter family protein [Lachnospiraceae bacterium]MDD7049889.1 aromatic acid exporter family protein [Lachnospiraceae bacterium]MDY4096452.1 aromatic acid exporter family protein [Lachnospiraceae bacterium]
MKKKLGKKAFILALKIGIGSSTALTVASLLSLQNAASAGIITLLTIVTTKWETIRLSWARILTFGIAIILAFVLFQLPINPWLMYSIYIFTLVLINESMDWKSTLSVNAVIGTHFLASQDFSLTFVLNEFMLVLIGITVAFVVNMFRHNRNHKASIVGHMQSVEKRLQHILEEMAGYLRKQEDSWDVWQDLEQLENDLKDYILDAYEYEGNTFQSHSGYYLSYFEMRLEQCMEFYSLHTEMKRMRQMPAQAELVADYMLYLKDFVKENNCPDEQRKKLNEMKEELGRQDLPSSYEEFENRALLYHVLSQLEAFIEHKENFVKSLDEQQKKHYWQ